MGMESYFITLDVENLAVRDSIPACFGRRYGVSAYQRRSGRLFQKAVVDDNRFVIDGKAVVMMTDMGQRTRLSFELCFSNFEENLSYLYNVAQWVSSLGTETKLIVLRSAYDFRDMDCGQFKKIVSDAFDRKRQAFVAHYGELDADILPQNFYPGWMHRRRIKRKK